MKLVLDRWQGLGDNLQVSTIPRRYYEKYGEKCVWISNEIYYRSDEIKDLVWESNPYIAGFTNEAGENLTHMLQFGKFNWIETWERVYGLDDPYSKSPELYLSEESDLFNIKDRVVVDISYSTDSYNENIKDNNERIKVYQNALYRLVEQSPKNIIIMRNKQLENNTDFINVLEKLCPDISIDTLDVENIFEYANAIRHCKQFICSHSGCHAVAASLRKSSICLIPKNHYNMNYFVFDNVRYIPV